MSDNFNLTTAAVLMKADIVLTIDQVTYLGMLHLQQDWFHYQHPRDADDSNRQEDKLDKFLQNKIFNKIPKDTGDTSNGKLYVNNNNN